MKRNSILHKKGPADKSQGSRPQRRAKKRLASKTAAFDIMTSGHKAGGHQPNKPGKGKHW